MKNGRDITALVENWVEPPVPTGAVLDGRYVRLERLSVPEHASQIFTANKASDAIWDFLPYGPFETENDYRAWILKDAAGDDPFFYAIYDKATGQWSGVASYLRITPAAGSIEVGHINFAPSLQKTPAATEAMYLMMQWAFEAGYRRYEWKCNAANLGSRRAAQRYGLSFEGVFRQAAVIKGRNRDTAWFAAIDAEWAQLQKAFELWLEPDNFDAAGRQIRSLRSLTHSILVAKDPLTET